MKERLDLSHLPTLVEMQATKTKSEVRQVGKVILDGLLSTEGLRTDLRDCRSEILSGVYILQAYHPITLRTFPHLIKIGHAENIFKRVMDLNTQFYNQHAWRVVMWFPMLNSSKAEREELEFLFHMSIPEGQIGASETFDLTWELEEPNFLCRYTELVDSQPVRVRCKPVHSTGCSIALDVAASVPDAKADELSEAFSDFFLRGAAEKFALGQVLIPFPQADAFEKLVATFESDSTYIAKTLTAHGISSEEYHEIMMIYSMDSKEVAMLRFFLLGLSEELAAEILELGAECDDYDPEGP